MNEGTKAVGRKDDQGKVRADLLPANALMEVAKVLTFGAQKYGAENTWQKVTPFRARYTAALMRHLFARQQGEIYDPESGLLHMAHMACCALFLLSGEVGHDGDFIPMAPPVPQGLGQAEVVAPTLPSAPGPKASIQISAEDPDADPPPSSDRIVQGADLVPKYVIHHTRLGCLVESSEVADAPEAFRSAECYQTLGVIGDRVNVYRSGTLLYTHAVGK